MSNLRLAIIGGGITGLTAAYRMHTLRPDVELTLFEAGPTAGGKVQTLREQGYLVEVGADSFLSRKPYGIRLCEELGLAEAIIGRNPQHHQTYILKNGTFHNLPEGLSGLIPTNLDALQKSTLLSADAIARIAQEPTIPAKTDDEDESLAAFFTRRLGSEAFSSLIQPLLGGIYGGDATQLSILATFPQLRTLERRHGSLLRALQERAPSDVPYPPFVSLRGGMGQLIDRLLAALPPKTVHLLSPVHRLRRSGRQYQLSFGQKQFVADAVIVCTPAPIAAELFAPLDHNLAQQLTAINYGNSTVVTLAFEKSQVSPQGYGFLVPRSESAVVQACSWSSNKWVNRAPADSVLARFFLRGDFGADALAHVRDFLRGVLGVSAEPMHYWLQRWPCSIPQYTLGHRERVATIERAVAQHDNLALAGAYFDGVGIPDCIRRGWVSAEKIASSI